MATKDTTDPKSPAEEKNTMPKSVRDAAAKMSPKPAAENSSTTQNNSLIVRPGAANRAASRKEAVVSSIPKRAGLPGEVPEEVVRQRQRLNELRAGLATGVAAVDHFVGSSKRLITELKNLKGGEDAANSEGVDLAELLQSIETIEAAVDKAFPAAE